MVLNTWEAVYFDHDPAALAELAELAAAIGIERFVVDDGWFTGRRDDTSSLGDWEVDRDVWPDGLGPLARRVHELGMEFGLWFEPEMVNLDSELAREHPEWLFDAGHGPGLPSRYQHVLDLGHPEAFEHVLEQVSRLVADLGIDAIKWDHNRYLLDAGHTPDGRPGVRAQTLAVYRMMAELRRRHPELEIESCASGGGRIDLGVLEYCARVWPSDCNDPHERLEVQRWTGLLVPPEMQGTHIGAEVSHTTHRSHPLDYRAEKAIWGNLGVEMNLLEADDAERSVLARWIEFHKEHRALLHSGVVVHADLADDALRLEGVVADRPFRGAVRAEPRRATAHLAARTHRVARARRRSAIPGRGRAPGGAVGDNDCAAAVARRPAGRAPAASCAPWASKHRPSMSIDRCSLRVVATAG